MAVCCTGVAHAMRRAFSPRRSRALEQLRTQGVREVGALFLVGEERGSDGARVANAVPNACRFLINGEPTDSRLGLATRGALRVKLTAAGRAGHSSFPETGESAIEKLLDALVRLRSIAWPAREPLGRTHYTIGLIGGGIAPNVIPPHAEAEVMFRTVGPAADVLSLLAPAGDGVRIDVVLEVPAVTLATVPGFETAVFPFTTDIPFLDRWGTPLLFGPGSILKAHTDHEQVPIAGAAHRGRPLRGARDGAAGEAGLTWSRLALHLCTVEWLMLVQGVLPSS